MDCVIFADSAMLARAVVSVLFAVFKACLYILLGSEKRDDSFDDLPVNDFISFSSRLCNSSVSFAKNIALMQLSAA
ncbi:MAG: hypothetical protein A3E82_03725 [Gammaproteobacteria bacterium RIFCSPHIGHO2_12_FULL_38_11]|nr:MAG: hypothetical protein A3E82_03725 [Gammaproteobacteria bacterium RIFCSPHIGHO2_12_FULL_38_11]